MAAIVIVYWRDIPAQVVVETGGRGRRGGGVKRELAPRFAQAIDAAAMRDGATGTDDYLAGWRRGEPSPCGDDLEAEAAQVAARTEAEYDAERLRSLIANGGRDSG